MELLYRCKSERVIEVPYGFSPRQAGASKLGSEVMVDFALALFELRSGHVISARFLRYAAVGASGVLVNETALLALQGQVSNERALAVAILCAMTSNFLLNNRWTFADHRLSGRTLFRGFLCFALVSGTGAFINHCVSMRVTVMFHLPLAIATLVGIAIATIWNYHLNRGFTWSTSLNGCNA
jgi:dolichol-phosphate mannosyltransferase